MRLSALISTQFQAYLPAFVNDFQKPVAGYPFHATGLFQYPLKTENQRFSDVLMGYKKEIGGIKWFNVNYWKVLK